MEENKIYRTNRFDTILDISYEQNIKNNKAQKMFLDCLQKHDNLPHEDSILEYHAQFFPYATDFLKSPFDTNKLETIIGKTLRQLEQDSIEALSFFKNKEDAKKLLQALIQESMLDFISEHSFFIGLITNLEFYTNRESIVLRLMSKKTTDVLSKTLVRYMHNNTLNAQDYIDAETTYNSTIRKSVAYNVVEFYFELCRNYQLSFYTSNQDYENNEEVLSLYEKNLKKQIAKLDGEDKKRVEDAFESIKNEDAKLPHYIQLHIEILNKYSDSNTLLFWNEEDAFRMAFDEFYDHYLSCQKI